MFALPERAMVVIDGGAGGGGGGGGSDDDGADCMLRECQAV